MHCSTLVQGEDILANSKHKKPAVHFAGYFLRILIKDSAKSHEVIPTSSVFSWLISMMSPFLSQVHTQW